MTTTDKAILLTPAELVTVFSLIGYEQIASDLIHEYQLISNDEEAERFIHQAESLLKDRGYWDEKRTSRLPKGLESFVHVLVKSQRKVRLVCGTQTMIIHGISRQERMIQTFNGNEFSFEIVSSNRLLEWVAAFYANEEAEEDGEMEAFTMDLDTFNQLHTSSVTAIEALQAEQSPSVARFLRVFMANGQELDNLSFMESHYVKDETRLDQVVFLLPSSHYIWHINYEQIREDETIRVEPIETAVYWERVFTVMEQWFQQSV